MATTTSTTDPNANRTRVGGILLTIGALLWAVGFGVFAFAIAPSDAFSGDTIPERAAGMIDIQELVQASGWIGVFADVFVAAGALFLVTRWLTTKNNFPASAFWLVVAIGALVTLLGDLVWGNGVVPVAQGIVDGGATPDTALVTAYDALETTLGVTFSVAFIVLFAGFGAVLFGETRAENAAIPNWASYAGILGAAVTVVVATVGLFMGDETPAGLEMALLAAYLPGLAVLGIGVRTGFPNFFAGSTRTTRRTAKAQV